MIIIKVTKTGSTPDVSKREFNRIKKRSYRSVGRFWHNSGMKAEHFTDKGRRKYKYAPRKGERLPRSSKAFKSSYSGRKLRQKGHLLPLVFSGDSRSLALSRRKVVATSKGMRAIVNAPGLNRRNPASKIDMRDEMTRVTPDEERTLIKLLGDRIERGFRQIKHREVNYWR